MTVAVPGPVQATVRTWDAADRSASLVLDDGTPVELAPGGLDPALRHLRPGQRVELRALEGGTARGATLPGLSRDEEDP